MAAAAIVELIAGERFPWSLTTQRQKAVAWDRSGNWKADGGPIRFITMLH
jgi:hypothetical protein